MPMRSWDSVTAPGCVRAWAVLSRDMGKLPFARLLEAAIHYSGEGFAVSPITAHAWQRSAKIFAEFPDWAQCFTTNGVAPAVGELFRMPDHARTLRAIADSTAESFYTGEIADRIDRAARAGGGLLRKNDLANVTCDEVGTIATRFGEFDLHEIPPNGQGVAALIALGIVHRHPVFSKIMSRNNADDPELVHLQIEAMKLGLSDAYAHVADPNDMQVSTAELLADDRLGGLAATIDLHAASERSFDRDGRGGTVYLTSADASGMMVSLIQSNFWGFGSGVVIPGTGIAMQNRGYGFLLDRDHPNCVGPSKRPFHTIIPGFITKNGEPVCSFGVMGGAMQAQAHLQMMVRVCGWGQNPQAALDAPRWRVINRREVWIESHLSPKLRDELERRGHLLKVAESGQFGGGQVIWRTADGGYIAASDSRKDGCAAGF